MVLALVVGEQVGREKGSEVNYSITGWLRLELFKQDPVDGGLGLITPAKATSPTLPRQSTPPRV